MSILLIDLDIFKWLQSIDIIQEGKRRSDNKIELQQSIANKFYDGLYISRILKKIIQSDSMSEATENQLNKMKSIKENSTPAIRLYNWNLITDVLKHFNYVLDYAEKSKILNLQASPINKLLYYLKSLIKENQITKLQVSQPISNNASRNFSSVSTTKQAQINSLNVDIKSITNKNLQEAKNIMEFLVISLSKNFKLSSHHTLNLFLDENKYLAHLLVKGIKESFDPILSFQNDILAHLKYIILTLFVSDQQSSLKFLADLLKPCLISKDIRVAVKCLDIFAKLYEEYQQNSLNKDHLTQWMHKQGVYTLLFSSKRHQQTFEKAISLSYKYLQQQLFQFIEPVDKSPFWSSQYEKLHFYFIFLIVSEDHILEKFSISKCFSKWQSYCLKAMKKLKSSKEISLVIKILRDSWMQMTTQFQKDGNLIENYVSYLKTTSFSNDYMLFVESTKSMFDLMEFLGTKKNNYAPVFYKTLVNCLSFQSSQQRINFIVQNFICVFKSIENLPGTLLIQPLLKSIERNCTVSTLNLCRQLIIDQKLKEDDQTQIIQILTKVFFEDINHGQIAINYIFECIEYLDQEVHEEYLLKNSQLCLSHFYSIAKSIKRPFEELVLDFQRYQHESSMKQGQSPLLSQIKKYLVIENLIKFMASIILKQDERIVSELEQSVFMTYLNVKIELQKPKIAQILLINLMRKYYDIDEELNAAIGRYQKKYFEYIKDIHKKKFSSGVQSEQEEPESIVNQPLIVESRMYASKSLVLEDSIVLNQKKIKPIILKPEKTALIHLDSLKKKMQKMKLFTEENQKKKDLIEEKKQLVRSILNQKRQVKFGSKSQKDLEYKYLFQFDTVALEKNISGLPYIEVVNLQAQQEDIYIKDIDSLMKKYRKVWRFMFFKYSTFGSKNTTDIKTEEKINISEVWKMHKEYNIDFIKKQESFSIVRIINENMKRKNDLQNLTYLGFQQYIVQFCIFGYNKIGITFLSPGQKILKLIQQFKNITYSKGGNSDIFSNPEEVYFQETDVIKQYNRRLLENPEYILPEGYKKIKQSEYVYKNEFTQNSRKSFSHQNVKFAHNQSYFNVLEILDEIFFQNQKLGFHLIQAKTQKMQKVLAKPVLFQQLNEKMKNYQGGYLMPKRQINSTYIASRQKVNVIKPQFHPLIQFSLGIKMGLSAIPIKFKYIGEEVAYWMDDMLDAIQHGQNKVINKAKRKIQNEAMKKKKMIVSKIKNQKKLKQKIEKQRSQSVRMQFQKIQVIKQQNKVKKMQQIRVQKQEQKKVEQKIIQKKLKQFQMAKKYFSEKNDKQLKKTEDQKILKKKQKQDYKKNVEQYFKKKKQELEQKQLTLKRDKQYQQKKVEEQQRKKNDLISKAYFSVLKKDQSALVKISSFKQKYEEFCNQKFVQEQFQIHRKSLTMLFELLLKHQKSKISTTQKDQISHNTFHFFALKFKIIPVMVEKNMIAKIFRSLGKQQSYKGSFGLSYRGFQQALLKIVIKSKKILNDLISRKKQKYKVNKNDNQQYQFDRSQISGLGSSIISNTSKLLLNENLVEQYLFDTNQVEQQTIRQFMLFLNLPEDKISLEQRYRDALEGKNNMPTKMVKKEIQEELIKQ